MNKPSDRVPAENAAVSAWLRDLGLGEYTEMFAKNGITAAALPAITDADLKEMGVHVLGHRRVMLRKIGEMAGRTMNIPLRAPKESADLPGLSKSKPALSATTPATAPATAPTTVPAPATTTTPATDELPTRVPSPKVKPKKRWGAGFLFLSIAAHLLFGVFAYVYIVHVFTPKKLVFKGGPPSPNPAQKAMEHKVQMRQKQKAMSAPVPPKRVATTALTKITLPDVPSMPAISSMVTPVTGMGSVGTQFGAAGMGTGAGGGGGGTYSFFGLNQGSGLVGTFYDLKRNSSGQNNNMTPNNYAKALASYVNGGWHDDNLMGYLKGKNALYATRVFVPRIDSHDGPKAFGSAFAEPPGLWVVHYKGMVSPPESGVYHFIAAGDDVMYVRLNGVLVMDNCYYHPPNPRQTVYHYSGFAYHGSFLEGPSFEVHKGQYYDIDILVGDQIPLDMWAFLMIKKEGDTYAKDGNGSPIFPIFRISGEKTNAPPKGQPASPPYMDDGPVWSWRPAPASLF